MISSPPSNKSFHDKSKMSTSSEKYELAQDEIDSVLEKLRTSIKKTEAADGEAKKRSVQVKNEHIIVHEFSNSLA